MVVDRGKGKGDGKGKGGGKGGTAAERRGKGSLDRSGTCSVSSRSILVSKHAIMAHVEDENTFVNVRRCFSEQTDASKGSLRDS